MPSHLYGMIVWSGYFNTWKSDYLCCSSCVQDLGVNGLITGSHNDSYQVQGPIDEKIGTQLGMLHNPYMSTHQNNKLNIEMCFMIKIYISKSLNHMKAWLTNIMTELFRKECDYYQINIARLHEFIIKYICLCSIWWSYYWKLTIYGYSLSIKNKHL